MATKRLRSISPVSSSRNQSGTLGGGEPAPQGTEHPRDQFPRATGEFTGWFDYFTTGSVLVELLNAKKCAS
jgi:hypothetical protein